MRSVFLSTKKMMKLELLDFVGCFVKSSKVLHSLLHSVGGERRGTGTHAV